MRAEMVKRILHAKDSQVKLAFLHNEIISRLTNGEKVTVVNMPEFELIQDTRVTVNSFEEIDKIQPEQVVFVFNAFPGASLMSALKNLNCKEINATIVDFSAVYADLFAQIGFDVLYIKDNYLEDNPVHDSVEELNAALLRTIT